MTKHNVKVYTHDVFLCGLVRGDQLIRPGSGYLAYDFMICPSAFQKNDAYVVQNHCNYYVFLL